jgi:hypothetical protein
MTTLGDVDICRTLYRDDIEGNNKYPLDEKIELLDVDGSYSRYTSNFAYLAAEFYAHMPERLATGLLQKTLDIELDKDSLARIGGTIAQRYRPIQVSELDEIESNQERDYNNPTNFIENMILEIDNSPNREERLEDVFTKGVEGVERKSTQADLRVMYVEADGTGVSGLPKELSNKGRNGGAAKTFEVKIGAVFTQSFDSSGLPLLHNKEIFRDPQSTKYTGTVDKVDHFTEQLDAFTKVCGIDMADQVVFLSDGAIYLEKLRQKLFPDSIGIIDLFHARQHLSEAVDLLTFPSKYSRNQFYNQCSHILDMGDIDRLAMLLSQHTTDRNRDIIMKKLEYFTENKSRMRYGLFRAAGLFIGSGIIESACKSIVENRLNGSGMRWLKKNAANVVDLRCAIYSGLYECGYAA